MFAHRSCLTRILFALMYAFVKHWGQFRRCDPCMPYIFHPILTAWIVWKYSELTGEDRARAVIVALLHDVLEDTHTTYRSLVRWFGVEIADAVRAMSHDTTLVLQKTSKRSVLQEKTSRLAQQPIWARVVEPAGRLANLLEPGEWGPEKLYTYASDSVYTCKLLTLPACKLVARLQDEQDLVYVKYVFWRACNQ